MLYTVKKTCYWDRYYKKGETVELDSTVTPPEHFEPVPTRQKKEKAEEKPVKVTKKEREAKASRYKNG